MQFRLKTLFAATACICVATAFIVLVGEAAIIITMAVFCHLATFALGRRGWILSRVRLFYTIDGFAFSLVFAYMATVVWLNADPLYDDAYWVMRFYWDATAFIVSTGFAIFSLCRYKGWVLNSR